VVPDIEPSHIHHPVGPRHRDLILAVVALFVSFISILIAWHHSQVMQELVHQNERLVEAESLPYVQISGSNGNRRISFNAVNEGVGPAKIVTAEILVDRRPVRTLDELIAACCAKGDYSDISASSLEGRMIRPGDTVPYIDLPVDETNRAAALALDRARRADRIETRLCYCSVFNDCWLAQSDDPTPDPVNQCVPLARPYRE
jgi:hypothetical protein